MREPKRPNQQCLYVLLWKTIPKVICQGQAGDIKGFKILPRFIFNIKYIKKYAYSAFRIYILVNIVTRDRSE